MPNNNKEQTPKKVKTNQLQVKESAAKLYNFVMLSGAAIAAYILYFNGNTTSLKVLAGVLVIDAVAHAWKLVAVVK